MKFILGEKIEMTQVWKNDKVLAVTKIAVGSCVVTQLKTNDSDGYSAVQLGFREKKEKNIKKPQKGHLKGLSNFRYLREFRMEDFDLKRGDEIDLNSFEEGDKVQITSISKGKGFQGVVKRHGFRGTKKTHGNKDQLRMPGSIGATGPAHVFKGVKMGGRMGGDKVTIKNQEIVEIDRENNIILLKGSVPGARNSLILISGEGELKIVPKEVKENIKDEPIKEEIKKENLDTPEKVEKKVVEAKEKVDEKASKEEKKEAKKEEKK